MGPIHLEFEVAGNNFLTAGSASDAVKSTLKKLGIPAAAIKRVAIAMYEGEINMVIHAEGGTAVADIFDDHIKVVMADHGKGIPDIDQAMKAGFSTASEEVRNLGFGAGMGLPNIKTNSDRFDIQSIVGEGTTLTFEVDFDK